MRHLATANKLWKLILLLSRVISEVCIDTQNSPSQNQHTHTYVHLTGVFGGHDAASHYFQDTCVWLCGWVRICAFTTKRY